MQTAGFVPVQCWLEKGRVQNNIYAFIYIYNANMYTLKEKQKYN